MRTLLLFRGAVILRSGVCRNRVAENSDLNAIAAGLNNNRIILQADNPSDDAALRENLISNFKRGAHRSLFFLLLSLRQKHHSSVYFSRELMANYFTYSAERGTHFVLFDDEETLRQKVSLAQRLGIPSAFVMYPEIADLLQAK